MKSYLPVLFILSLLSSCTNHGTHLDVDGDEMYYQAPVTEATAFAVAGYLKKDQFFIGGGAKAQILMDSMYTINLAFAEKYNPGTDEIIGYQFMLLDMSNALFEGKPININLCDNNFKPFHNISFTEATSALESLMNK
jgi:hypothetical protein